LALRRLVEQKAVHNAQRLLVAALTSAWLLRCWSGNCGGGRRRRQPVWRRSQSQWLRRPWRTRRYSWAERIPNHV